MDADIHNIIGGRRRTPSGERRYRAINPSDTSDLIEEYRLSSAADVAEAVAAARAAAPDWASRSAVDRGEILHRAGALLRERAEAFARQAAREIGKPVGEARGEALYAAKVLEFYAAEGTRLSGETLPSGRPGVTALTHRRPIGVVGLITPWNFPVSIPAWKLGPALVCGNTAVWKPCLQAPFTSQMLGELLLDAGVPEGVVNLLHGDGPDVGQAIVDHAGVDGVSFTGSRAVGEGIYRAVSARLGKVQCELGGKNPLLVMPSADLDLAVTVAVEGAFRNAGQKCTATSRIIVDRQVKEAFTGAFLARVAKLRLADAREEETFLGPLVDERQYDRVRGFIRTGLAEGGRLLRGGDDQVNRAGYFVAPTVFDAVDPASTLAREEVFGPVVALFETSGLDEAVAMANDTEYGLSAAICTRDLGEAQAFMRSVVAGVTSVNLPTAGLELHAPFGGAKASGHGIKEQGRVALDFYTEWRTSYVRA